jgi:multidrug efflux pump subunit AcrA (membrane-fusion protein)
VGIHTESTQPGSRRRARWRWALGAAALIAALGIWWFAFRSDGGSASAAGSEQLVAVTQGPIGNAVTAEGTVAAAQTANLSFGGAGTVTAVDVKAGDAVTTGQVLATIDSAQLGSAVSAAQASLATAQAKLADDQSSGVSSDQLSVDQTSVTSANDNLASAQQALAGATLVATFDGTVSQVNITVGEQLASNGTGATSATGTGTGSGQSAASLGSGSTSGGGGGGGNGGAVGGSAGGGNGSSNSASTSPAIQVVSQGQYTVTLSVSPSDVGRVAAGQGTTLTVTTSSAGGGRGGIFGQLFGAARGAGGGAAGGATGGTTGGATTAGLGATATGTVASVSKVATTTSGVAGYPVVITFDADANAFYPGATVSASIATEAKDDVLQVPTRAISTRNGSPVVTVATTKQVGGPTEVRTVTTGITAGGETEITSGLTKGEDVVITLPTFGGAGTRRTGGFGGGGAGGFGGGAGGFRGNGGG